MFNTSEMPMVDNGGSWMWFFVILLVLFGGFNGNNHNGSIVYGDTPATTTEVYAATNNQSLFNRLDSIGNGITASNYENAQLINQNANMINTSINSGFDSLSRQLSECCCNLKTEMMSNRLADTQLQLQQAQGVIANQVQTQNILNNLGRYYPVCGVNPYSVYGAGTTIA